jgi:hypothetical protein
VDHGRRAFDRDVLHERAAQSDVDHLDPPADAEHRRTAAQRVRELFEAAVLWVGSRLNDAERRDDSLRLTAPLREDPGWEQIRVAGENAATSLAALDVVLRRAVSGSRDWLGGVEPDQGVRELEIIRGRLHGAAELLQEAILTPDRNRVYWFTLFARTDNLVLRAAPINVGTLLRDRVYTERRSTVFTSATLAVGGTFDYFRSRVGLSAAAGKKYRNYSLGMKQRLGLAAALLQPRDLLVLDEPTNGLDPQGTREVRHLVRELASDGTTVLVSSHLLSEIEQIATHVGIMSAGRLVRQGSLDEVLSDGMPVIRVQTPDLASAARVLDRLALREVTADHRAGVVTAKLNGVAPEAVASAVVAAGVRLRGLGVDRADLEDLFVSITGEGFDVVG